jgi:2-methylcitrate dehydratase PrpD
MPMPSRASKRVTKYTYDKLCYLVPDTGLEAKFSMPYTIARALLDDSIGFETFTDALVRDERACGLTRRVRMYTHDGIERNWKMGSRPVHVSIKFRDGSVRERQVDISKGNPEVPMTDAELGVKFRDCARACLDSAAMTTAIEGLKNVETFDKVSALTGFCAAAPRRHDMPRGALYGFRIIWYTML